MNDPRALTAANDSILSTALTPQSVVAQVTLIQQIMHGVMKPGEHYGAIPGVRVKAGEKPKMVLLKPGAEKLCFTFQLVPAYVIEERQLDRSHREYRVVTRLTTRSGVAVGEGVGTCSTMESKYRYRNGGRKCPKCHKEAIIQTKSGRNPGGYWCVPDKGGCNSNFNPGDADIEGQEAGKVENQDPADQYNTVLKMAKKRSIVDATITACAASDIFTQDLEELPEYEQEAPQMTQAQRNAAAASEKATDVPTHNLVERAEASRLWTLVKARDKHFANVTKRECGTDAAQMIRRFREYLDANGIDHEPIAVVGSDEASALDEAAAAAKE